MSKPFMVPEYLTGDIIESALQTGLNSKNLHVRNVIFSPGSSGGDNYCSEIIRALVTYSKGGSLKTTLPLIIKSMPKNQQAEMLVDLGVFRTEKVMYMDILPKLELKMQEEISAKCFYNCEVPVRTFIFKDLNSEGFKLADRSTGLDFEHAKTVMKYLGKYHAASMVFAKENPSLLKSLGAGHYPRKKEDLNDLHKLWFVKGLEKLVEISESMPEYEHVAKKLRTILNNFFDLAIAITNPADDKVKVINHGDLWVTNVLFRYKNENPVDMRFVDFQFCVYSSPGIDINYFLNTSLELNVYKTNRHELLSIYYNEMHSTLIRMNHSDIPSWEDIRSEIHKKEFYGFMAFATLFPVMAMSSAASADNSLDSMCDEGVMKKKQEVMYSTKRFRETMQYCLDRFDKMGVLDLHAN